ncbi:MAG: phenylalanine--tRNA ligase subunit alpha [bacterium]|nr:phenylalanine--tRNA ligase subunit alpha [bacterium]
MRDDLLRLESEAHRRLSEVRSPAELDEVRRAYLGKKGSVTQMLKGLASVAPEDRPAAGQAINDLKNRVSAEADAVMLRLETEAERIRLEAERLDVTLPGRGPAPGRRHPLTKIMDEIKGIFMGLGFQIAEGPEVETDYYNFEALNMPSDHPARDTQDSFYISDNVLLRTHTSPVQIRYMEAGKPSFRAIMPGRTYRRDAVTSRHSPIFHQVEGLVIDRNVTFTDLKGTLTAFSQRMFGQDTRMRFRPDFFPFTEPSAEIAISCFVCKGKGCRLCSGSGWLEILGAGMVHPRVIANAGHDPEEWQGFAFGMGVERIALLKYGIDDIRYFFENDLRFLKQL